MWLWSLLWSMVSLSAICVNVRSSSSIIKRGHFDGMPLLSLSTDDSRSSIITKHWTHTLRTARTTKRTSIEAYSIRNRNKTWRMIARRDETIVGAHETPQKHKNEMRTTWESHVNWCAPCTTSPYHSLQAYNIVSFLFCFHFIWCVSARARARRNDISVSTIIARDHWDGMTSMHVCQSETVQNRTTAHSIRKEAFKVNIYLSPRSESQQRQRRTRW